MAPNLPYNPAKQVPVDELRAARDVLRRMLDGGELLASVEAPMLRGALPVLDSAIAAAENRARKAAS